MRRIMCCVLCILLMLSGCGLFLQDAYVVVEPHQEDRRKSQDETITVSSYSGLKNAILNLIEDGVKNGEICAESYQGTLDEDLSQAVYEVAQISPLGVFAVEHMTYDYSRIVSYYEIHLNITFRRTVEEIASIVYVTGMDAVRKKVTDAMENYEPALILRVGNYEYLDIAELTKSIYEEHPEFSLELPETSVESYPNTGTQRILEIKFSYRYDREKLLECQASLGQQMEQLSRLYGSTQSDMTNARRLYKRVGRDAVLLENASEPLQESAYGLLVEGEATSYGFAQCYLGLLRECGIEGDLVSGRKAGETHHWCLVKLDGAYFYVDPSLSPQDQQTERFLLGTQELLEYGYQVYLPNELPEVVLPEYLLPARPEAEPES